MADKTEAAASKQPGKTAKGETPSPVGHGKESPPAPTPAAAQATPTPAEKATSGTAAATAGTAAKAAAAGESSKLPGGVGETAPLPPPAVQPPSPVATAGTAAGGQGAATPPPPAAATTTPAPPVPSPPPSSDTIARVEPKTQAVPGGKSSAGGAAKPPVPPAPGMEKPPVAGLPPQQVARYNSEDEVLLGFDAHNGAWQRVPEKEMLFAGERLLVLPTYRDEIGLTSGVTVQMVGGTQVELLPREADSPPGLEIAFGRLVLAPLSQAGAQVRLTVGGRSGVLTMVNAESIATLEVTRRHVPGSDPEEKKATRIAADLCVAHGSIRWKEKDRDRVRVTAPARLVLSETSPLEAVPMENRDLPKWIVEEPLPPLERRA